MTISLLGTEKAVIQQQSTGGNNQQTNDNVQQLPAETQPPATQEQPSGVGSQSGQSLGTTTNGNEVIVTPEFDTSQW